MEILESRTTINGRGNNKERKVLITKLKCGSPLSKGKKVDFEKGAKVREMTAASYFYQKI